MIVKKNFQFDSTKHLSGTSTSSYSNTDPEGMSVIGPLQGELFSLAQLVIHKDECQFLLQGNHHADHDDDEDDEIDDITDEHEFEKGQVFPQDITSVCIRSGEYLKAVFH